MKTITINRNRYKYSSDTELRDVFKKYPYIKIGANFEIGNNARINTPFTAGDRFTAGDWFTAGYGFMAGNDFTADDWFRAGYGFTAGCNFEPKHVTELLNEYKFVSRSYLSNGTWFVQMGCYLRTLEEWEADFWNNPNEFPNDGSEKSNERLRCFELHKAIINIRKNMGQ